MFDNQAMIALMESEAWHRQPDESARAYAAFETYCELGPERSCTAVALKLSKSRTLITRWSARHDWQARVAAFDSWLRTRRLEKTIIAREAMMDRHATDAAKILDACRQKIEHLNGRRFGLNSLARLFEAATKVERIARGEPDEEQVATVNIIVRRRGPDEGRPNNDERRAGTVGGDNYVVTGKA